jgi:hypothetical protein
MLFSDLILPGFYLAFTKSTQQSDTATEPVEASCLSSRCTTKRFCDGQIDQVPVRMTATDATIWRRS